MTETADPLVLFMPSGKRGRFPVGTSVLEAAMDELVERLGGRLQITVPAGNAYQSRTHANAVLSPRTPIRSP